MKREIINRGYLTHALTNDKGEIYGIIKDCYISKWEKEGTLYWSEVFVDGNLYAIIRKGIHLCNTSTKDLCALHEQSKINLNPND